MAKKNKTVVEKAMDEVDQRAKQAAVIYAKEEKEEIGKMLLNLFAGQALQGLLGNRESSRRLTDGEILFLTEDAWKLARGMLVSGGYPL